MDGGERDDRGLSACVSSIGAFVREAAACLDQAVELVNTMRMGPVGVKQSGKAVGAFSTRRVLREVGQGTSHARSEALVR